MGDVKTDVSLLENHVFETAKQVLLENGEFLPFAAALGYDNKIVTIEYPGEEEYPDPEQVVNYLSKKLQFGAGADKYIATALAFDSRTIPPGMQHKMETIAINLDHINYYSVIRLTPYQLRSGQLGFGPTFMQAGNHLVFVHKKMEQTGTQ